MMARIGVTMFAVWVLWRVLDGIALATGLLGLSLVDVTRSALDEFFAYSTLWWCLWLMPDVRNAMFGETP